MKISIAMAYTNRLSQLRYTLSTLRQFNFDGEIVICDDFSRAEEDPRKLISEFPTLSICVVRPSRKFNNPCVAYNTAFRACTGDAVIIQNPECCWTGDIAAVCRERLGALRYLSFGCLSIQKDQADGLLAGRIALTALTGRWYNHSSYRPVGYHFCAAIMRQDLNRRLGGGFDERFADGCDFDDDELVFRVKAEGFDVQFIDSPHVVHQWHPKAWMSDLGAKYMEGHTRNSNLFSQLKLQYGTSLYRGEFPSPATSTLVMGSCRVESLSDDAFETASAKDARGNVAQPATYTLTDAEGWSHVTTNPAGYAISPYEFLDLLRVATGQLKPVSDERPLAARQEAHKFLKQPVKTDVVFDRLVLEVCSLNYVPNTTRFKAISGWGGATIPYKLMYHDPAELGAEHLRMSPPEVGAVMQQIIEAAGIPASRLHVIGTYWFNELGDGTRMSAPVQKARAEINAQLASLSAEIGFQFTSMQDVLGGDDARVAEALQDNFHLNALGRQRVSAHIRQQIRGVAV